MPDWLRLVVSLGVGLLVILGVGALLIVCGGAALRGEDEERDRRARHRRGEDR